MSAELMSDIVGHGREINRLSAEPGLIAGQIALLALEIARLREDFRPRPSPGEIHLELVDEGGGADA